MEIIAGKLWLSDNEFRVRFYFSLPPKEMVSPATDVAATRSASDSNLRCRTEEWFRLQRPQPQRPFITVSTMVLHAGHSLPPRRQCCRRAIPNCRDEGDAAILKSGPEIKNQCTLEGVFRQIHAVIPKSGPEIKNRCSSKPVLEAGHSSLQLRKLESDAEVLCRYDH